MNLQKCDMTTSPTSRKPQEIDLSGEPSSEKEQQLWSRKGLRRRKEDNKRVPTTIVSGLQFHQQQNAHTVSDHFKQGSVLSVTYGLINYIMQRPLSSSLRDFYYYYCCCQQQVVMQLKINIVHYTMRQHECDGTDWKIVSKLNIFK